MPANKSIKVYVLFLVDFAISFPIEAQNAIKPTKLRKLSDFLNKSGGTYSFSDIWRISPKALIPIYLPCLEAESDRGDFFVSVHSFRYSPCLTWVISPASTALAICLRMVLRLLPTVLATVFISSVLKYPGRAARTVFRVAAE